MERPPLSDYRPRQHLIEACAIGLFALLAAWSLGRLCAATGWAFPAVVLVAAPCGWLAADLFSGLVHFAFDSLGSVHTPFIGNAFIRPFREHHVDPQAMTRHGFVETNGASSLACLPALGATSLTPLDSAPWILAQAILLFAALGTLATNQCHKWAHMDEAATPAFARRAQRYRLILPREHHQLHHTAPFDSHFCTSCGWLNPALNALLRTWR
ncbi:MAG: fatty acid desaturase CarF family protein [Burkholderiales bacterium]